MNIHEKFHTFIREQYPETHEELITEAKRVIREVIDVFLNEGKVIRPMEAAYYMTNVSMKQNDDDGETTMVIGLYNLAAHCLDEEMGEISKSN